MAARKADTDLPAARMAAMVDGFMRTMGQQGEMGVAAARTIGYRTAMMAGAMGDPVAMADPEFVRMGAEKVEAVAESATALYAGLSELQHAWIALITGPVQAATLAFAGMGKVRSPMDLIDIQRRWYEESVNAGMNAAWHFAESAADLTAAGMAPLHKKASANARRLARVQAKRGWW